MGEISSNVLLLGVILAAVAVILVVLFFPGFGLLRGGAQQSAGDGYSVKVDNSVPPLPAGLVPASRFYEITVHRDMGSSVSISLPLLDPKGVNRGLSFYTFQGGSWQRLGGAEVSQDGASGQGQIPQVPKNLLLLKRQGAAIQVMASLPAGKALSPEAASQITALNPAGFIPAADGSISGEQPPAVPGAQYDVVPAVEATDPGSDAAKAVDTILTSSQAAANHATQLAGLANRPGNNGVELDYTAVSPQNRQAFADFVASLAQAVHAQHHVLGLELPAPTLSGSGWSTGSYDWTALAKSADYLKLLPPLDESVYRKQMPDLLKFLTGESGVPAGKLVLVTSPLSVEKTDTGTRQLSRLDALSLASQIQVQNRDQAVAGSNVTLVAANLNHDNGGSGLVWDGTTATVSFVFKVGDATHVVWIANQFSEGFKLEYAEIYHLGGVAVADASADPALGDVWPAVAQFVATGTPILEQPNPALLVPTWLVDGKPLPSDGKAVLTWAAPPQPGSHTISLIVSDGVIRVQGSMDLTLRAAPPAGATATAGPSRPAVGTPPATPRTPTPGPRTVSVPPTPTAAR